MSIVRQNRAVHLLDLDWDDDEVGITTIGLFTMVKFDIRTLEVQIMNIVQSYDLKINNKNKKFMTTFN
jgi:hypothetical protein